MADLNELLEKVKAASLPDDELDEAICVAVGCKLHEYWWTVPGENEISYSIPPITASIDAALALVERVLPGFLLGGLYDFVERDEDGAAVRKRSTAVLANDVREPYEEDGNTRALSILAALLTALIAKESAK